MRWREQSFIKEVLLAKLNTTRSVHTKCDSTPHRHEKGLLKAKYHVLYMWYLSGLQRAG